MKKVVRILVKKSYKRMFNILMDDSSDVIAIESAVRHIVDEDDSKFFFEEDHKSVLFAGMDLLDNFPFNNNIEFSIHRLVTDSNSGALALKEVTANELTELHVEDNK
jgi:hypothetical protein